MKRWALPATIVLVLIYGTLSIFWPGPRAPIPTSNPATLPTTAPTTQPATQPKIVGTYVEAIIAANPEFPTTQPLGVPLDFSEAAHFRLPGPIRLCTRGDMWITDPNAPPIEKILKQAFDDESHVTCDEVMYVHWTRTEQGRWNPTVIVKTENGFDAVSLLGGRKTLPAKRQYIWNRAKTFGEIVAVPTSTGVSILEFGPQIKETFHEIPASRRGDGTEPQIISDPRGILAWRSGGSAARFVAGKWIDLNDEQAGWSKEILHLIPLLDGSVLQMFGDEKGVTKLSLCILEPGDVDENHISQLVDQLSDPDETIRDTAYIELTRYGPGLWPILEKLLPDQSPEAQIRMRQLLKNRIAPSIGGMTLVDGKVQLQARFDDGSALFYARGGVEVPRRDAQDENDSVIVAPAWISIRPNKAVELLPIVLSRDLVPGKSNIANFGSEWIVFDPAMGPERFVGNHFVRLTKPEEKARSLIGMDRRGRWLFRTGEKSDDSGILIVDHTLPDPSPRLPVWTMHIANGKVGWNDQNWPAVSRGGGWVLEEKKWRALDEKKNEQLFSERPPKTQPTTGPADTLILLDIDGTRYFDGQSSLIAIDKLGKKTTWPLPAIAAGHGDVTLIRATDGKFFLFNEPGRVLRIRATSDGKEPYAIEATFTREIPNSTSPTRIWLDPAGRINIVAGDDQTLSVLFPGGHVPPAIAEMMPAGE